MKFILKILKRLILFILILVGIVIILNVSPYTFDKVKGINEFRKTDDYPLVVPHGGAKRLAPENTIYSFDMLEDMGIIFFEIDLSLTKDGKLISHHDLFLDMSSNSEYDKALIRNLTYQEIIDAYEEDDYYQARNFTNVNGVKEFLGKSNEELSNMVPARLKEDILEKYKNQDFLYMLEIKDNPKAEGYDADVHDFEIATQTLIDLIVEYDLEEWVVIGSFDDDVITYIKDENKDIKVGAATDEATKFAIFSALHIDFFWKVNSEVMILPNPESMKIPSSLVNVVNLLPNFIKKNIAVDIDGTMHAYLMNKQLINDAHRKNIAVYYWTINDPEEMRLLIKNGADGIITDRPDLLIEIINELKNK